MGQSLHVKRHLGGAGTHAAGVRDNQYPFVLNVDMYKIQKQATVRMHLH